MTQQNECAVKNCTESATRKLGGEARGIRLFGQVELPEASVEIWLCADHELSDAGWEWIS
ncbi:MULTISPECIES: hypothetical protein [Rhodococcus]|uniref:hypothetical protein n=1 Tax=Rhodococcus TaxID=1827 RepID=UPI000AD2865F|nr:MULTISPECIES: hypothetical protein [Rhodococcus]MBQ9051673.1 hypothetical protein [Rhodococcus sp. (in: high G+C Gram-positive bacteria)]MCE4165657.1 hypothetical protein [Rhodococcus sp. Ni2]